MTAIAYIITNGTLLVQAMDTNGDGSLSLEDEAESGQMAIMIAMI